MSGLYLLALERLAELEKSKSGIIRFPVAFEKLCSSFQIKKREVWELLLLFREFGFIEIVPYQGVKIKD